MSKGPNSLEFILLGLLTLRPSTGYALKKTMDISVRYIIAATLSFPLYSFFYGFFGGWDKNTLGDFHRAVNISNFAKPVPGCSEKHPRLGRASARCMENSRSRFTRKPCRKRTRSHRNASRFWKKQPMVRRLINQEVR
jgi:hypothetical protein